MGKKRVGILFGGKSGEHEVSLISGASVYTHIDTSIFTPILIGVDFDGRWYLQAPPRLDEEENSLVLQRDEKNLVSLLPGAGLAAGGSSLDLEVVFPVLHGTFGEDGTVQGLLEVAHVPYVGAGVLGSSLGMDKGVVKKIWLHEGLATVPFVECEHYDFLREGGPQRLIDLAVECFGYPLFVKPSRAGSSVGVARAENPEELKKAMTEAFRFDTKLLIEPEIRGREVECSVTGNEEVRAYAVGEIVPSHEFYDYEAKYLDPEGAELRIPAPIDEKLLLKVREIAAAAYRAAEAEGFARLDFFIREDGTILLNEINTIPGFTHISMFPKLCDHAGLGYRDLITHLIELGLDRFAAKDSLLYRRS